jgi:uncharacterized protein
MELSHKIKEEAREFFSDARGSHDWSHVERVYNLCVRIGKKEDADIEILKLAAILHDIGREYEDESGGKICHAEKGAVLARKLLEKHDIGSEKIDRVVHCIEAHRFRGGRQPRTKEAKVLFDADKLDSIGAVGIGRAFLFAGEIGAKLHNNGIDTEKTKPYTKEDTAYREFMVKLGKVKDMMFTQEGKRIAEERDKFMADFFGRLDKEVEGVL